MNQKKKKISLLLGLFAVLCSAGGFYFFYPIYQRAQVPDHQVALALRWQGLIKNRNFRDLGASLNECLGVEKFSKGIFLRSNVYFSGFDCNQVGSPDVIYSLNYDKPRNELYFCVKEDGEKVIGRFFNPDIELKDLEFIETWDNPQMKEGACKALFDILKERANNRRILVHCDAGRDRTGTVAALLAAGAWENFVGRIDESILSAIECDYQKTKSLALHKRGRMRNLILEIKKRGGMNQFLLDRCNIDEKTIKAGLQSFMAKSS